MRFEGRRALITGAGSGIGRALAIEASRRGMILALAGRRRDRLEETRGQLARAEDCLILPGDVTAGADRREMAEKLARAWGRLDVLVNNAGLLAAGPLAVLADGEVERLLATNLAAPIALTRDMLPLLRAAEPARVVNMGSMLGDIGFPLFAAYSASKYGLRGFSDALRRELKGLGVGVTHAAPRAARTDAAQAVAGFIEPFAMPLDDAECIAGAVWDAVARDKDAAYPRGRERLFLLIERLAPALVSRAVASQLARNGLGRAIDAAVPPVRLASPPPSAQ